MKMEYKSDIFIMECLNHVTNSVCYDQKSSHILNKLWTKLLATQIREIEKSPQDIMKLTGPIWLTNMLENMLAVEEFKAEMILINAKQFPQFVASKKRLEKKRYLLFHEGMNTWGTGKPRLINLKTNVLKQQFIQAHTSTVILHFYLIQQLSVKQIILNRRNVEILDRMSAYLLIEMNKSLRLSQLDTVAAKNFSLNAEWVVKSSRLHPYFLLILNLIHYSRFHSNGCFVMSELNPK